MAESITLELTFLNTVQLEVENSVEPVRALDPSSVPGISPTIQFSLYIYLPFVITVMRSRSLGVLEYGNHCDL
jgi:hypothetical protein